MATVRSISTVAGREPSRLGLEDIFQLVRDGNAIQVRVWLDNVMDDMNQGDDHGHSLLHWACKEGHTSIVDMLIARGTRVLQTNLGDDTPLHLAASHGHRDIVQRLLKNGADVNFVNEHGNTPLHYACFWRYENIAEDLINAGANVSMCNKYGDTPLDKCNQSDIRQSLQALAQERGQDVEFRVPYKDQSWLATRTRTRDATLSRSTHGIDLKHLSLGTKLGSSPNGESWKGRLHQSEVVAKILRVREVTPRVPRDFQDEAPRLRIFSHPNVLPVIAYNAIAPNLVLVSEYMPLGSLYKVLHVSARNNVVVDQAQCLRFALDVAKGMSFLHALSPALPRLHLNSKHVMVDEDLTARISLADVELTFQNRAKIYEPAWISPEALNKSPTAVNLKAADMWSYAVLLWELMTREVPFAEYADAPMVLGMKIALEGLRLQMAPGISAQVSRLILICMNENPGKRPTFDQIIPILEKMYNRVAVEQNQSNIANNQQQARSAGGGRNELEREDLSSPTASRRNRRSGGGGAEQNERLEERVRATTPERGDVSMRVGKAGVKYTSVDNE